MTRADNWSKPLGVPTGPRLLEPGLKVLAQFDAEQTVLDPTDIVLLTGCPSSIARRYLVMLCDLGYLTEDSSGAYRLSNAKSNPPCDDGGTLGSVA
jgi:hypothetical protein